MRQRDDRGRAFAFWKRQRDLEEGTVIAAIRVDVILEIGAPKDGAWAERERAILTRRAEGFLPASLESVWVAPDLSEITDKAELKRLSGRYSSDFGDVPLHSGRWAPVERALGGRDWDSWCADARDTAERIVRGRDTLRARIDTASDEALRDAHARVQALRGRQLLAADSALALSDEERAAEGVREAIQGARLLIDAMGLVILSSAPPEDLGG